MFLFKYIIKINNSFLKYIQIKIESKGYFMVYPLPKNRSIIYIITLIE